MSETTTKTKTEQKSPTKKEAASSTNSTSGGSGSAGKAAGSESKSSKPSKPVVIQNGKGSAPRNMGPRYLSNFDRIKWERNPSLKPAVGQKAVKVYR